MGDDETHARGPSGSRAQRCWHVADRVGMAAGYATVAAGVVAGLEVPLLAVIAEPLTTWALIVFVASYAFATDHDGLACEACAVSLAACGGAAAAEQHASRLRAMHRVWAVMSWLSGLLRRSRWTWLRSRTAGAVAAGAVSLIPLLIPLLLSARWGVVVFTAMVMWWRTTIHTHHMLQAWCPWCRDDGDDDGEEAPAPAPGEGTTTDAGN